MYFHTPQRKNRLQEEIYKRKAKRILKSVYNVDSSFYKLLMFYLSIDAKKS